MENDNGNVAGAPLLKSLSAVDILTPVLQEFKNIFLNKCLRKSGEVACTCFIVMTLH